MRTDKNKLNINGQDNTKEENTERSKKPKKVDVDIEKYKDPEGLTVKHLNFGLWFVEHKHQLFRLYIVILVMISAATWSYFLYGFGDYLIFGMKQDKLIVDEMVNTSTIGHSYFIEKAARDLIVYPPQILNSNQGRYDFIAKVQNPNSKHWGGIKYSYQAGGVEFTGEENFILPGESKYLALLANELNAKPANVFLKINKVEWHRISPHDIQNFNNYKKQRLKIEAADASFTPASEVLATGDMRINDLEFTARNNSAYSYWEVNFIILLYQRGAIIGVNEYSAADFYSQTERKIRMSWPGRFGRVDQVEVTPEVNIMDLRNYIIPEGESGTVK